MSIWAIISAILGLATVVIKAARDPSWARTKEIKADEHLQRCKEFGEASKKLSIALNERKADDSITYSAVVRQLFLDELGRDGSYLGELAGGSGPTVEIPLATLTATFSALSGRRRDVEIARAGHITD